MASSATLSPVGSMYFAAHADSSRANRHAVKPKRERWFIWNLLDPVRAGAANSLPDDAILRAVVGREQVMVFLFDFVALDLHRRRHEAVVDGPAVLDHDGLGDALVVLERAVDRVHVGHQLLLELLLGLAKRRWRRRDHEDRLLEAGAD